MNNSDGNASKLVIMGQRRHDAVYGLNASLTLQENRHIMPLEIHTALRRYQDINQAFQAVLVFLYMDT